LARAYGLVPFLRLLARWPLLHLGIAYASVLTLATIIHQLALRSVSPNLDVVAWALGVVAFSVLVAVITWYRDDDNVAAAVLIVIITGIGLMAAFALTGLVFTGSIAAIVFTGASAFFWLVIRAIIFVPITVALVWTGRRLRRFFAPATLNDERFDS
jgi:hypothetical protein